MVMNPRQQIATVLLAVLIVASVMVMPRTLDAPRDSRQMPRASGMVAAAPAASAELSHDQVRDLTYN